MTTTDTRGLCPPSTPDYRDAETYRARCGELERLLANERAARERAERDTRDIQRVVADTLAPLAEHLRAGNGYDPLECTGLWVESVGEVALARIRNVTHRAERTEANVGRLTRELASLTQRLHATEVERGDARAEVERLRAENARDVAARLDAEDERNELLRERLALREQVETLTRERDEWQRAAQSADRDAHDALDAEAEARLAVYGPLADLHDSYLSGEHADDCACLGDGEACDCGVEARLRAIEAAAMKAALAAHAAGLREGTDYSAVLGERWAQDRLAELAAQSEEIGRLIVERERLRDAARDLIAAVTVETIGDAAGTAGPEPFARLAEAIGGDQ